MAKKIISIFGTVPRNQPHTRASEALKKLKENGTYDAIMKKYFAYSIKV